MPPINGENGIFSADTMATLNGLQQVINASIEARDSVREVRDAVDQVKEAINETKEELQAIKAVLEQIRDQ